MSAGCVCCDVVASRPVGMWASHCRAPCVKCAPCRGSAQADADRVQDSGKAYWDKASKNLINKRKRRLEEYILALASHKVISRDDVYMSFLQFPDDLYSPAPASTVHGADDFSPGGSYEQSWEEEESLSDVDDAAPGSGARDSRGDASGGSWRGVSRQRGAGGRGGDGGGGGPLRVAALEVNQQISVRNAAERLVRCSRMAGTREEAGYCKQFVEDHFEAVRRSEGFLSLPRTMLEALLASDRLRAREEVVFDAALAWAEAQVRGGSDAGYVLPGALAGGVSAPALPHLTPLLKCIRFPLMSPETLVLRVLNGKEAATCPELRELATEAVMWQAVPLHLRDKVRLVKLLPQQCRPRSPAPGTRESGRGLGVFEVAGQVARVPSAGAGSAQGRTSSVVAGFGGSAGEIGGGQQGGAGVRHGEKTKQAGAAFDEAAHVGGGGAAALGPVRSAAPARGSTDTQGAMTQGEGGAADVSGVSAGRVSGAGAAGLRLRETDGRGAVEAALNRRPRLDIPYPPDFHRQFGDDTVCFGLCVCVCVLCAVRSAERSVG